MLVFANEAVDFALDAIPLKYILNDVGKYCHIWNFKLYVVKTKMMIFENGRPTVFLYNAKLEIVESVK